MALCIEKDIVSLVIRRGIDLNEVILQGADEQQIAFFQLVALAFNDVRGIAIQKINQLIHTVCVHGIGVAGDIFRALVFIKDILTFGNVIVHVHDEHLSFDCDYRITHRFTFCNGKCRFCYLLCEKFTI